MKNRLLLLLASTLLGSIATTLNGANGERPNVVVVMTDDQGYPELSVHGNPVLQTPQLDKLHAQSIRLTDYHASPMCTPTRGSLLTGLDPARHGAINVSSGRSLLRQELPTMANFFQDNGYKTGVFGKWHLGDNYPYRPNDRGFEESIWFPSSHISSVPDVWSNDYFSDTYMHNTRREAYQGYCTDVFFKTAITWMKQCAESDQPFFAYIPTNAPHSPLWAPAEEVASMREVLAKEKSKLPKLPARALERLAIYLAMVRNIDSNMGRLEQFLQQQGLRDNTIVIFATDNGSTFAHSYYPAGMRGRKTQLWEGGHRVPCFFRWPSGELGNPRDLTGLTQTQDILPTLIDLCRLDTPDATRFDGISLAPYFHSGADSAPKDRTLVINYSRMPGKRKAPSPDSPSIMRREGAAVLYRRWRLLQDAELYDLDTDPLQTTNVIDKHPKITSRLRAHLDRWWDKVRDTANEPQAVIIGHEAENPMMLTACEWMDVFVDQQNQVRGGTRKNSYWTLDVAQDGIYKLELRRWPREANAALTSAIPAVRLTAGSAKQGKAIPIASARIAIQGIEQSKAIQADDKAVIFTVNLKVGRTRLQTWFDDKNHEPLLGAYYVYVHRQ